MISLEQASCTDRLIRATTRLTVVEASHLHVPKVAAVLADCGFSGLDVGKADLITP